MLTFTSLRSQCDRRLGGIPVPQPFDLAAFTATLNRYRGRELRITALPCTPAAAALSGAWLPTSNADYVFFDPHASPWHRNLIVLHEIGHILCDHTSDTAWTSAMVNRFLPALPPDLIRRTLGRHGYTTSEECEAETVASLILERADADPLPLRLAGYSSATARMVDTLRHPVRRAS